MEVVGSPGDQVRGSCELPVIRAGNCRTLSSALKLDFQDESLKIFNKRLKSGLEVAGVTPQVLRKWLGRTLSRITTVCQNCHILNSVTFVKEAKTVISG